MLFLGRFLVLKVKLVRSCTTTVGIYRPPSILKSQWKHELFAIFEAVIALTNDIIFAGHFNADLIEPNLPLRDCRDLMDLLEIFHLNNTIKSVTQKKTKQQLSLVYTILWPSSLQLCSCKINFQNLKTFSQDLYL